MPIMQHEIMTTPPIFPHPHTVSASPNIGDPIRSKRIAIHFISFPFIRFKNPNLA